MARSRLTASILTIAVALSILTPIMMNTQKLYAQEERRIVVALAAEPRVLDPFSGAWHSGFVAAQIFNSLLEFDQYLRVRPSLAESWEILPNEGAYVFKLRKGVKFHDGKPLTPEDVKFSFEEVISKYDIFGALYFKNVKVEILNESAVKIKPERFLPGVQIVLFASMDTAIVPKHVLEGQEFEKSEFRVKPIGTGPFKFVEWSKGNYIILERNENYWKAGKPRLDRIVIRFITDPAAIVAALQAGEIDYVFRGVPYEAYDSLANNPNLDVIVSNRPPYKMSLWFNTKHPILSNPDVRRAIAYALDKEEIARRATNGLSKPTYSFWTEDIAPTTGAVRYEYNPEKAEELLDKAGYPRGSDGKRFTIELLTRTGEPEEELVSDMIRDYLSRVGIEVKIKRVDFGTYLDLQSKFQYDFTLVKYWIMPFWSYQLFHSAWIGKGPFTNVMQYSNPEVDRLFDQWLREPDPDRQKEILVEIDRILTSELPAITLYDVIWLNVKSKRLKGPDIPVGKYVFWDPLENMYIETPETQPQPVETATPVKEEVKETKTEAMEEAAETMMPLSPMVIAVAVLIVVAAGLALALRGRRR